MMTFGARKLVRESEWMRVFEIQNEKTYFYESKFLIDDLHVSPVTVRSRWPEFTLDEKVEFASAFGSQPPRDNDDQQVLEFLMDAGPEEVWRAISKLLPFHRLRARALEFLLVRVRQASGARANYYQALESLQGSEAVSMLRQQYEEYRDLVARKAPQSEQFDVWIDYLHCSKALWTLTQDPTYRAALKDGLTTAPPELRSSIAHLLREVEAS